MTVDEVRWQMLERSSAQLLELLASVPFGRVIFTHRALPSVRVVSHVVLDGLVVLRSDESQAIVPPVAEPTGAVVAYEADAIDADRRQGWSVVVTGTAVVVRDADRVARYAAALPPLDGVDEERLIVISPELVTGYELGTASPAET